MRSLTLRGIVVQQVGGDDLEVVIGGVGEGALAVAVAHRPDAGIAAQLVVDDHVAALVEVDPGLVQAQVVGVGLAAHGQQHVRAGDLRRAGLAGDVDADAPNCPSLAQLGAKLMHSEFRRTFTPSPRGSRGRRRRSPDPRGRSGAGPSRPRSPGAEAAEHLGELQPDIAAADDHQVLGQRRRAASCRHWSGTRCRPIPGMSGRVGAAADIEEDLRGGQQVVADPHGVGALEAGVTLRKTVQPGMPRSHASTLPRALRTTVLAFLDPLHVDPTGPLDVTTP
jgi:hypothetical protein